MSTGRLVVGVLVTLLTAALSHAQPSSNLSSYALFADTEIRASGTSVSDGDVGVNTGQLIARKPLLAASSAVAADTVDIDPGSTCDALFSNNVQSTGPGCDSATPFTGPILDLAAACGVGSGFPTCGSNSVTVDKRGPQTLTPGTYGAVTVKDGGTLTLQPGDYVFCSLRVSHRATLVANGAVRVVATGRLAFSTGAQVGPAPGVEISPCDVQFVGGGDATIDRSALVRSSVCAPNGRLRLRDRAALVGTFAAGSIRSGRLEVDACAATPSTTTTTTVSTTTTTLGNCGNGTVDSGETCDPPGSSCTGAFTGICQSDCQCPGATTTTTTISTTTTTLNNCGNGTVDSGETCDPPGSSCTGAFTGICQSDCQCPGATTTTSTISTTSTTAPSTTTSTIPAGSTTTTSQPTVTTTTTSSTSTTVEPCGNGTVDAGETCDPPGSSCTGAFTGICQSDCQCPGATTTTTSTISTTSTTASSTTSSTVPAGSTTTTSVTSTTSTTLGATTTTLATTTTTIATTSTTIATTSTTLATTTTTSSTTSTTIAGCCGFPAPGPSELSFTTGVGSGNCGTVQLSNGTVSKNLACSGLYTGGGGNTVPLPYNVPDMGTSRTGVSACNSGTNALTLTNLTSAETGSNRNCSSVGCLFGAPLPIPNAGSTPTSVCVVNVVATNASGTANCATGVSNINLPLSSVLYLTGDLFPAAPGIQVCPVCNPTCTGGSNNGGPCNGAADCPSGTCGGANVCHGGANDGDPCTPEDSVQGTTNSFPTSHDCPPPDVANIGALPIAFNLTTGSTSRTAVNNAASGQNNVFCGFCRDLNGLGTGCFAADPNPICPTPAPANPIACTSNAGCPAEYPDCVQRSAGAFGPAGGGARTITETGSPAGDMRDGAAHASTLASIFCIQPTFNATVDAAGDLPGPGAVTLQGQAQLLP